MSLRPNMTTEGIRPIRQSDKRRRKGAMGGTTDVYANPRSDWESVRDLAGRPGSRAVPAVRFAHVCLACGADRLNRHLPARTLGLADAARRRFARLSLRFRYRYLERRLDHVLGSYAVQHPGHDRV